MAILEVEHLEKRFGGTPVLQDVSFSLEQGQTLAILGSSGSGKTTLLRCLNALEQPDAGCIRVAGETLFDGGIRAAKRGGRLPFGLVFQAFHLFPQYTVRENVTLMPLQCFENDLIIIKCPQQICRKASTKQKIHSASRKQIPEYRFVIFRKNNFSCVNR